MAFHSKTHHFFAPSHHVWHGNDDVESRFFRYCAYVVSMGKMATSGVVPALVGLIMNISGSLLAGWWSKK